MNIRTAISIALIIFAIGLCFWLFVRPLITTEEYSVQSQEIDEDKLFKRTDGSLIYLSVKEEVREWSKILANFAPLLALLIAYFLKKKK